MIVQKLFKMERVSWGYTVDWLVYLHNNIMIAESFTVSFGLEHMCGQGIMRTQRVWLTSHLSTLVVLVGRKRPALTSKS